MTSTSVRLPSGLQLAGSDILAVYALGVRIEALEAALIKARAALVEHGSPRLCQEAVEEINKLLPKG